MSNQYVFGTEMPGNISGVVIPLGDSLTERIIRSRSGAIIQGQDLEESSTIDSVSA